MDDRRCSDMLISIRLKCMNRETRTNIPGSGSADAAASLGNIASKGLPQKVRSFLVHLCNCVSSSKGNCYED